MEFNGYTASQIRIARPTDQLENIVHFYEKGLKLQRLGSFQNHSGYDGVMYGLPGTAYHLEFTSHSQGSPCRAETKDQLLVFYIESQKEVTRLKEHLEDMGYPEVEPENPYWKEKGVTIEDPDGWRVVLMQTAGI